MLHSFKKCGFAVLTFGLAFAVMSAGLKTTATAQQIVPQGLIQFTDGNGAPLAGGTVAFYIPNTLTPKTTWNDQTLTVANTNPVTLDAYGRAAIWGKGNYRQIVKDIFNNQIWDRVTSATDWTNVAITGGTISGVTLSGVAINGSGLATNSVPNSALAQMGSGLIKSNVLSVIGNVADNTLTSVIDAGISNVQGSILYRGASVWSALAPGTSGQLLQTLGPSANPAWYTTERISTTVVITSSGNFTIPAGVDKIKITLVGAGGNGFYGGGGGGGTIIKSISGLTPGTVIPVTVGAAPGGSTYWGTPSGTVPYASGGGNGGNLAGGVPGGGGNADIIINGSAGGGGCNGCLSGTVTTLFGTGGNSFLGGGGGGAMGTSGGPSPNGGQYGGGGGGGSGIGGAGVIIVEY